MKSRLMLAGAAVAGIIAAGAGCGSTPTSPAPVTPPPAPNVAPVIASMSVKQSRYRTGQITASASDPDGHIASGTVIWGDGQTSTLTNNFASIALTHEYGSAHSFPVTLQVTDDRGAMAQQMHDVNITVPPESCVGILIVKGCARVTSDFKHVNLSFKAGSTVLGSFSLNDGQAGVSLPLAAGFGKLNATANLHTGRITLTGEVCTVPFLVCKSAGTAVIQF